MYSYASRKLILSESAFLYIPCDLCQGVISQQELAKLECLTYASETPWISVKLLMNYPFMVDSEPDPPNLRSNRAAHNKFLLFCIT